MFALEGISSNQIEWHPDNIKPEDTQNAPSNRCLASLEVTVATIIAYQNKQTNK